jgi:hypothetical protein
MLPITRFGEFFRSMWLCYSSNTHMPNKIRLTPHICTGIDGEVCWWRMNSTLLCAMKFMDGMGGNPHWFYQGASEPLGLCRAGRSVPVSSMPLKGTGEARCAAKRTDGMGGNPDRLY